MCWHKFTQWSSPFRSITIRPYGNFGDTKEHPAVIQIRTCEKCNASETRTVYDGDMTDNDIDLMS
jgi:hypothetical protein